MRCWVFCIITTTTGVFSGVGDGLRRGLLEYGLDMIYSMGDSTRLELHTCHDIAMFPSLGGECQWMPGARGGLASPRRTLSQCCKAQQCTRPPLHAQHTACPSPALQQLASRGPRRMRPSADSLSPTPPLRSQPLKPASSQSRAPNSHRQHANSHHPAPHSSLAPPTSPPSRPCSSLKTPEPLSQNPCTQPLSFALKRKQKEINKSNRTEIQSRTKSQWENQTSPILIFSKKRTTGVALTCVTRAWGGPWQGGVARVDLGTPKNRTASCRLALPLHP